MHRQLGLFTITSVGAIIRRRYPSKKSVIVFYYRYQGSNTATWVRALYFFFVFFSVFLLIKAKTRAFA
jgi:hypothetical protein